MTSNGASGTVTVSGSSSVSPLMQKLIEGYNTVNPNVEIELQTSDSTTGMTDAINGMSDIGMASRELKQEELDRRPGEHRDRHRTASPSSSTTSPPSTDLTIRAGAGHLPGQHHRLV